MKLIIDIDEEDRKDIGNMHFVREDLKFKIGKAIIHGTPLDDVKTEMTEHHDIHLGQLKSRSNIGIMMFGSDAYDRGIKHAIEILDNIDEAESEE